MITTSIITILTLTTLTTIIPPLKHYHYNTITITQDDAKVVELVGKYGAKKWSSIAQELKGRIGKQCRCVCVCVKGGGM